MNETFVARRCYEVPFYVWLERARDGTALLCEWVFPALWHVELTIEYLVASTMLFLKELTHNGELVPQSHREGPHRVLSFA